LFIGMWIQERAHMRAAHTEPQPGSSPDEESTEIFQPSEPAAPSLADKPKGE